jgi:NRPS condensation-like uncharacterized protein
VTRPKGTHRAAGRREGAEPRGAFSVVDEVTCYFDTSDEPANIHMEMRVPHPVERRAFRAAALAALAASPRAASRRARRSPLRSGFQWERPEGFDFDPVTFTEFASTAELMAKRAAFLSRSPSIDASPPARLLVASGPGCAHVILNAHHATMDGISWLELLRDIGRRYRGQPDDPAGESAGSPPADLQAGPVSLPPAPSGATGLGQTETPDATRLGQAETPDATGPSPAGRAGGRPARIAADGGGHRGLGLHMTLLPGLPLVRPSAAHPALARPAPTLNDALIAALIATVGRWNADHGRPARAVRITVPVNARTELAPTAGNLTRLVTISARPPGRGSGLEPLLLDVARQTRNAREQPGTQVSAGTRGIAAIWCPAAVKRWLVRAALRTAGPVVCDTVMLTNLGKVTDPPDFGGGGPVTMAVSGPAQMPRGLSVAVMTAGGQPQIAMRHNRKLLSDEAAGRFLSAYEQALAELTLPADDPAGLTASRRPLNADWSSPAAGERDRLQPERL